jgi:hypothetical protein
VAWPGHGTWIWWYVLSKSMLAYDQLRYSGVAGGCATSIFTCRVISFLRLFDRRLSISYTNFPKKVCNDQARWQVWAVVAFSRSGGPAVGVVG